MPRHLVTGATGFIGRHLVRVLRNQGEDVACLVRASSDTAQLEQLGARLVCGDMTRPDTLPDAVAEADVVYHLASLLKVPWKPAFRSVNVNGTRNLAEACAASAVPPVFVMVSSLAAGGPTRTGRPRRESDGADPVSRYGRVKLASERAALGFAPKLPVTIVRPPMVFGQGDRMGLNLFRAAAKGWHAVPGDRGQRVAMVHAEDLCRALIAAGDRGQRHDSKGDPAQCVYYVADDHFPSVAELGEIVAKAVGSKGLRTLRIPAPLVWTVGAIAEAFGRVRDQPVVFNLDKAREALAGSWICDSAKARDELAFAPESLTRRMRETADWYRSEGWL